MLSDHRAGVYGSLQDTLHNATTNDGKDMSIALFYYIEALKIAKKLLLFEQNEKKRLYLTTVDTKITRRISELEKAGFAPKDPLKTYLDSFPTPAPRTNMMTSSFSRKSSQMMSRRSAEVPKPQEKENPLSMSKAVLHSRPGIGFDDVAGLEVAKQALNESIIMPIKLPHLFSGATRPWRGILLYGPPGTGKSFIAKAVAGEAKGTTFLTVPTSELTSKWQGESEKLISNLFETARRKRPSIIFIDEIDSLVSARGDQESETGRRIKTEFLIQLDGVSADNRGVVLIGATNTPWDLDPAMRRRFEKRIYIPLPDEAARYTLIKNKLKDAHHSLTDKNIKSIAKMTDGFSGADLSILIREALMMPIRELQKSQYFKKGTAYDANDKKKDDLWIACSSTERGCVKATWDKLPPNEIGKPIVSGKYFNKCLKTAKPSVSKRDLRRYEEWTKEFGEEGS